VLQGFLISRPQPAEGFEQFARRDSTVEPRAAQRSPLEIPA